MDVLLLQISSMAAGQVHFKLSNSYFIKHPDQYNNIDIQNVSILLKENCNSHQTIEILIEVF